MTNRRRSGKGRASNAKKTESPDKQTRKLTRRGRRSKKSESPERPEGVDSEVSGDERLDKGDAKNLDGEVKNENFKDETSQLELLKSLDEQKSQTKEEESGGSDGSWKVKSENGGGGGIPKLKLCLTRPPEMSSPTSTSEQNPSPRRKRRSGRGNATPTKEEDPVEESVVEGCSKRVTRNQRAREALEQETVCEEKNETKPEPEQTHQPPVQPEPISQPADELESQLEPESKLDQTVKPESESGVQKLEEVCNSRSNEEEDETRKAVESIRNDELIVERESSEPVGETKNEETKNEQLIELSVKENETEDFRESKSLGKSQAEEKITKEEVESTVEEEESIVDHKSETEASAAEVTQPEPETESKVEPPEPVPVPAPVVEKRRSSSRDSSEERAKEAALRSRNRNKKKEPEVEEVASEISHQLRSQKKSKVTSPVATAAEHKSEGKENFEEPTIAKAGARKRRWGSSTNKNSKKPSVSISTDFLKEIIPEVKPLLMSEVQLSPNEEDEEGQMKDAEENLPVISKKTEREKMMQSDESEKDYEEEAVESGADEIAQIETVKPAPPVEKKEFTTFTRKVSVLSSNEKLQKSPSPPRHKPSNILFIANLVRPFTIPQLRELLARTGTITEGGFWIDKIKSKCYVKYETEEEAKTTRHALHGVRWPVSNPKQLIVDFGTEIAMKAAMEGNEVAAKRPIPSLFEKQANLKANDSAREREREKESEKIRERSEKDKKERGKQRESEKRKEEEEKKARPPVEPLVRDRTVRRVTMPVREWDLGKNEDGFSPPPDGIEFSRHRDDRYVRRVEYDRDKRDEYDDRRRREKDRNRRSMSGQPPRKSKKKSEEETPAKLLDDLFRKTKATPCIYWLPLTPEQISVKEEMRRKHMAEHEKKVAELRKMQREQSKRGSDAKRRRRTKSRSRSRSVKK